jgi:3-oxoacyl-[acyl-carrier protein] reductase
VPTLANVELVRAALPALRERRGAVVFISSVVSSLLPVATAPYAAAKAALEAIAVVMAREERAHGVRVNVVAPTLVATDMGDRLTATLTGAAALRISMTLLPWGGSTVRKTLRMRSLICCARPRRTSPGNGSRWMAEAYLPR